VGASAVSIAAGVVALCLTECSSSGEPSVSNEGGTILDGGNAGADGNGFGDAPPTSSDALASSMDGTTGLDATLVADATMGADSTTESSAPSDSGASSDAGDGCGAGTLASSSLAVSFANMVLATWPDPRTLSGTTPAWEYNAGVVLHGIQQVYLRTQNPKYLAYIKQYVDDYVDDAGIVNMPDAHSFDNIQPAILLPFLWQQTGDTKYQLAALGIRTRFNTIPRNPDLGFWHKSIYPNQMWLDGIYMGEPFLSKYGATFDCDAFCDFTVVQQTTLIAEHVQDDAGLLYHAWDDTKEAGWANATTGVSPWIWGRGDGWFAMSLVDTLGDVPTGYAGRSTMLTILQQMAAGLKSTQDPTTGLWYEVVDQGTKAGNWTETSGSGMFVYALKVAMDRGYIDSSYQATVTLGWQGLKSEVTGTATSPVINDAAAGLDPQATFAGYIDVARESNSTQGLCAVLLAASEMEATCP
jgi:unsaturated rhamnogalacturonyl hydrolase